jgi:DNA-binding PadR family transcriptional regulator
MIELKTRAAELRKRIEAESTDWFDFSDQSIVKALLPRENSLLSDVRKFLYDIERMKR